MGRLGGILVAAALIGGALTGAGPAAAQGGETSLDRLQALGLPVLPGDFPVHHSLSAGEPAKVYAAELAAAVRWYRDQLGWDGKLTMAVLDAADFARVTPIPYPSPHAATRTGLVIMPDRIDTHPGFDQWDLEPLGLNAALTFHEIGHVIAAQGGLWADSHWINELVANVFLAGYVRAERPAFAGLLGGVPPRFAGAGRLDQLADLDLNYFAMGQLNYAWFQFRIAAIADRLVAGSDFRELVVALREAFPPSDRGHDLTIAETFARLERISPGITAFAADLAGEPSLPVAETTACGPEPAESGEPGGLYIDNRSAADLLLKKQSYVRLSVELDVITDTDLTGEARAAEVDRRTADVMAAAEPDPDHAIALAPGRRILFGDRGAQVHLGNGRCLIVPGKDAMFVWTGAR